MNYDLVKNTEAMSPDEDFAEYFLRLFLSILRFEQVFFNFLECRSMQLIKIGD